LKKEKELRISPAQEDEERDEVDRQIDYESALEGEGNFSGDDENTDDEHTSVERDDVDTYIKSTKDNTDMQLYWRINTSIANHILSSPAVYTPSRDIVDNFVPGTLDEDQLEWSNTTNSPPSPHDIDPTYPSEEEEDAEHESQDSPPPPSPMRFLSKNKGLIPRPSVTSYPYARSNGLNRTHSMPWGGKRNNVHLKPPNMKNYKDQPRCAAITIARSAEHKRHHRREKKDVDICEGKKGLGVEAMAALARRLTTKRSLGLWAVSV
jgi:hypothetical protein